MSKSLTLPWGLSPLGKNSVFASYSISCSVESFLMHIFRVPPPALKWTCFVRRCVLWTQPTLIKRLSLKAFLFPYCQRIYSSSKISLLLLDLALSKRYHEEIARVFFFLSLFIFWYSFHSQKRNCHIFETTKLSFYSFFWFIYLFYGWHTRYFFKTLIVLLYLDNRYYFM